MSSARAHAGMERHGAHARPGPAPEAYVLRAREGDRDAFAALYRARFSDVARYVRSMVRDQHRAEDAVAQTFLLAWRDLPKLRRADRFDAWLFRIAHNQAMSELRRRPATPLEDAPEPADPSRFSSPADVVEARMDAERLHSALRQLPETQRQVLILRFLRGLSHAETAVQLGSTEQATRALQYRALAQMRRLVQPGENAA